MDKQIFDIEKDDNFWDSEKDDLWARKILETNEELDREIL